MKRIKRIILIVALCMCFISHIYAESCLDSNGNGKRGSVSLSTTSLTITKGKTATFKINASCAAGRFSISSSDSSVATVSSSSAFLDNESVSITVTAKNAGSASISIVLDDVGDYASNVLSGTKTVNVTVKNPATSSSSSSTSSTSNSTTKTETKTTVPVIKEMKIKRFEIIGYNIEFDANTLEYTINVTPELTKLYIIVSGDNMSVSGDKEVNITDKDSITVSIKDDKETKNYIIHLNKKPNEVIKTEVQTVEKEVVKVNNVYLYSTIGLGVLSLLLLILLISSKKKKTKELPPMVNTESKQIATQVNTQMVDLTNKIPTVNPNAAVTQPTTVQQTIPTNTDNTI